MKQYLEQLLQEASRAGAAYADAIINESSEISANIYQGELEKYEDAATRGVGVRTILADGRTGYAYSESLSDPAGLVQAALALADIAAPDEHAVLYPGPFAASENIRHMPEDDGGALVAAAQTLYGALSARPEVQDTYMCAAITQTIHKHYASTAGAMLHDGGTAAVLYAVPVVGAGDYREMGIEFRAGKNLAAIQTDGMVEKAVERGMRYFNAGSTATRSCPVILHGEAMVELLQALLPMFSGERAQQGMSQLKGKEGQAVAAPSVTLTDAAHNDILGMTALFDGEGVPVRDRNIIDAGTLTTLLYDVRAASKGGKTPTGNAGRGYQSAISILANNIVLQPGTDALADLAKKAHNGVMLYEVSGLHSGANAVSGDFSLLCKGCEIVNGEFGAFFTQAVVSGNFYQLFQDVVAVGREMEPGGPSLRSFCSPAILVERLSIAGS